MTKYFERIAECIKEECGKLPHKFRLDDKFFSQTDFNNREVDELFRGSVERLIDKLDLVSWNIVHLKQNKVNHQKRILMLEESTPHFVTHHHFMQQL